MVSATTADVHVGVTGYQMLGSSLSGRKTKVPRSPLHAASIHATVARCGAQLVEVLDQPWPPGIGRCRDCYIALLPPRPGPA
jgi:hypothetical protein